LALDIARIEAGYILNGVDYIPAHHAYTEDQKSSPYEAGLGWAVKLAGANFIGKKALLAEREKGSSWAFIGVEIPWFELERRYHPFGLRPDVAGRPASRTPAPLYYEDSQMGQITSHTFSPLLKKMVGIGMVQASYGRPDQLLDMVLPIEYSHELAQVTVVALPFFNPIRKRSV
jgi:aminomethyltransferase